MQSIEICDLLATVFSCCIGWCARAQLAAQENGPIFAHENGPTLRARHCGRAGIERGVTGGGSRRRCEIGSGRSGVRISSGKKAAFQQRGTAHEVEVGPWRRMLQLGRSVYGAWLELFGDGDAGDRVVLEDGPNCGSLHGRSVDPLIRTPDAVLDALLSVGSRACVPCQAVSS